jgi:hypothetical protein
MTTITVPEDKAAYLQALSSLTVDTLKILAGKANGKTPEQLKALESKLKMYQAFI